MKKILCYLGILFLLFLILLPPILRINLPDKKNEEKKVLLESITLSCENQEFVANTNYFGENIKMIVLKRFFKDQYVESIELKEIFDQLKEKTSVNYTKTDDGEVIQIDFSVSEQKNLNMNILTGKIDDLKIFYEKNNLVCSIKK